MRGYKEAAMLMKALAHPTRLRILEVLLLEGESCVCHLEFRLGKRQAYISQQLTKLREAGLVIDRREGLNVFYGITFQEIDDVLSQIKQFVLTKAETDGREIAHTQLTRSTEGACSCPKCEQKISLTPASK